MSNRVSTAFGLALLCTFLLLFGACDTSLEPFARESGLYSINGILTLSKDTHYIRIKDINQPVPDDGTQELDATVTLENLDEGRETVLEDSVVSFDGVYTHNYKVESDIEPGATYRLRVERSDGQAATAHATMPPVTDVDISADEPVKCLFGPNFKFRNVPENRLIEMSVGVPWNDEVRWIHRDVDRASGFQIWRILENTLPREITDTVQRNRYCRQLQEDFIRVAYTHYGPNWPVDSIRTNPVKSTVKNGLGLFGGVHRDTMTIRVDTVTVQCLCVLSRGGTSATSLAAPRNSPARPEGADETTSVNAGPPPTETPHHARSEKDLWYHEPGALPIGREM